MAGNIEHLLCDFCNLIAHYERQTPFPFKWREDGYEYEYCGLWLRVSRDQYYLL
jgi:hypothetical protein